MWTKNTVTGVHQGSILTQANVVQAPVARRSGKDSMSAVTASLMGPGGGMSNVITNGYFNSQYQYMMTGLIPADPSYTDTTNLSLFYRDIYMFDNVAGSAVDILTSFPFSDYELKGLPEKELQYFADAMQQLNIRELLSTVSNAYLVDGFFCGTLLFDRVKKQFIDTLVHDALQCTVLPTPFFNMQPEIQVRTSNATQNVLNSNSPYVKQHLANMPKEYMKLLRQGSMTLNPASTMFISRRSLTDRAYMSFLHRILPMYLVEKTMFRGTLVEASRRQRAMTHITAGTDTWTPSPQELQALVDQFMTAEADPLGGWITTREGVAAQDLRPGGDFWKWMDVSDSLTPYKLRALGISESFLSGDASYASAETAYSTFLETMNAYRTHLTHAIFTNTLFPLVAIAHGLYKDSSLALKGGDVSKYLSSVANRNNLKIPELMWHKSLEAKDEDDKFDMLEKASEKGVPIPLKQWMAAAGIDSETLIKDLKEDSDLRKQLEMHTGKDTSHEGEDEFNDDEFAEERRMANASTSQIRDILSRPTGMPLNSRLSSNRRAILSRNFGSSGEIIDRTRTGKPKYVYNQRERQREANQQIAKIAHRMEIDPNYRIECAKKAYKATGKNKIDL